MNGGESSHIHWHTAFVEALKLELEAYEDALEFFPEYQLTAEPLRIDCVVVKKAKGVVIKKNIAAIFREWNLVEYKSPDDYVSVADFYKVYAYACLYASLEKAPITGLTVSFVESRYPGKLLKHLKEVRGYTVEETSTGIYTIRGDILPIQVIDSRQLSAEENLWLRNLTNRLDAPTFKRVTEEAFRQEKGARITAYIDAIMRANLNIIKEAMQMETALTLEKVLEDAGLLARWEARGETRGKAIGEANGRERTALDIAQKLKNKGLSAMEIVDITGLSVNTIEQM